MSLLLLLFLNLFLSIRTGILCEVRINVFIIMRVQYEQTVSELLTLVMKQRLVCVYYRNLDTTIDCV